MDASRDVTTAVECYEQAIGLWRGDPLADVEALFGYLGVTTLRQELVGVLNAQPLRRERPRRTRPRRPGNEPADLTA
jgi:hypothetical protein